MSADAPCRCRDDLPLTGIAPDHIATIRYRPHRARHAAPLPRAGKLPNRTGPLPADRLCLSLSRPTGAPKKTTEGRSYPRPSVVFRLTLRTAARWRSALRAWLPVGRILTPAFPFRAARPFALPRAHGVKAVPHAGVKTLARRSVSPLHSKRKYPHTPAPATKPRFRHWGVLLLQRSVLPFHSRRNLLAPAPVAKPRFHRWGALLLRRSALPLHGRRNPRAGSRHRKYARQSRRFPLRSSGPADDHVAPAPAAFEPFADRVVRQAGVLGVRVADGNASVARCGESGCSDRWA